MCAQPGNSISSRLAWTALAGLLLGACSPVAGEDREGDFLLITIDTLRTDFVSAYGSPFETTPTLDALAAQGVLLEGHHAVISLTAPSHLTMLSGLLPTEHGLRRNGPRIAEDVVLLPELLSRAGYRTGAFMGASIMRKKAGFDRGFEVFMEVERDPESAVGNVHERPAEQVIDDALEFLEDSDGRPTFLWVHLYDPHYPYAAPEGYLRPASETEPVYIAQTEPSELFSEAEQLEDRRRYEAEVRYCDDQLGRLMEAWDERGRGRRGLVVVTSDHGEGLGEHDYRGHGFHLYQEQLRVPLILRFEGHLPAGRRVQDVTSAVDLPRTLLELLGVDARDLGGHSLVPLLTDGAPANRVALLAERREWREDDVERIDGVARILELHAGGAGGSHDEQVVLQRAGWKYIWTANSVHELYDLTADPAEQHNRIDDQPELAASLAAEIEAWRRAVQARSEDQELDEETLQMLRALGY